MGLARKLAHESTAMECLAACIRRAKHLKHANRNGHERYWHVRDRCVEIARSKGISIAKLIFESQNISTPEEDRVLSLSMWLDVAHPDSICEELHEL
jgi:hypothetical protein